MRRHPDAWFTAAWHGVVELGPRGYGTRVVIAVVVEVSAVALVVVVKAAVVLVVAAVVLVVAVE